MNTKYACMKYLKDNGHSSLLDIDDLVKFEDNLFFNEKLNSFYNVTKIKEWKHTIPQPDLSVLNSYSSEELEEIKKLYELSKDASEGKLIICNTHTSNFVRSVAKPGCLQWCLTDNYLKIFMDGEFKSIDPRIGGTNLDIPISNNLFY